MSRASSLFFGTAVLACVVATAAGCTVSVKTKTRFVEPNVVRTDTQDWVGGPITVNIQGVGVASNGGVTVTAVPGLTKVTANARMLGFALAEEKANADLSITEAKATFAITNNGAAGITIACGHGGGHGSSGSGDSGCEFVKIEVPAGTDQQPLDLKVLSGNGPQTLSLASAVLVNLGANANGAACDINADIPATLGANVSLVSEKAGDLFVTLPPTFAADVVTLQADEAQIVLGPFTNIVNNAGRGTAGTGFKSLKLTSKEFAGSTGAITLR